jgi:hypothetical protein
MYRGMLPLEDCVLLECDSRHWILGSWLFEATQCSHIQGSKCTVLFLDVSAIEAEGNMFLLNVRNE